MTLLRDCTLVLSRSARITATSPTWALLQLVQPVLYLVLFGPLLTPLAGMPGFPPGNAYNVLVPGLLVLLTMFSTLFAGFGLLAERDSGVLTRIRATPISHTGLLLGRTARDTALLLAQALLLVALALPLGFHASIVGLALVLPLLALLALAMATASYALALGSPNQDAFAAVVNALNLPVLLLSGILLPLSLAPTWLRWLAAVNPLSHTVTAARLLLNGEFADGRVLLGFAVTAVLAGLCLGWALRRLAQHTG